MLHMRAAASPEARRPTLALTHGDVGQLVGGAMRVDAVQVRPITVQPTEDQRRADVALIPEQHKTAASGFSADASVHPAGGGGALLSSLAATVLQARLSSTLIC